MNMNFVEDKEFNELVNNFLKLSTNDKKLIVDKEIKELIASFQQLNAKHNLSTNLLYNRELLDINKENSTEDDFIEAMYVYIHIIEELIAVYIDKMEER